MNAVSWAIIYFFIAVIVMIYSSYLLAQYGHPDSVWFWHHFLGVRCHV